MSALIESQELIQGSDAWLALRKTKITATDASAIMGINPWKTALQLYNEKLSDEPPKKANERMQRGTDLEPIARDLFCVLTGHKMVPKVIINDWAMASLDGINDWNEILEIKCPGAKDHALAVSGKIPEYYYPQLQHQMYVCDSEKAFYFSFDGIDGVIVEVKRDDQYIEKMIAEEFKFYMQLQKKTPPEPSERDFIERDDDIWHHLAMKWRLIKISIEELEKEELELRNNLIFLTGGLNAKGAGISLNQVTRKGNVDYSKVPELMHVDLDKYRKDPTTSWRITQQ